MIAIIRFLEIRLRFFNIFFYIYIYIIGNAEFLIHYQFSLFLLVKLRNLAFRNLAVCSSS